MRTNQHTFLSLPHQFLLGLFTIATIFGAAFLTRSFVEQQIRTDVANLLSTHKQSINNTAERLQHLPIAAALDHNIIKLLESAVNRESKDAQINVDRTNRYLETIASSADASIFYVLDVYGNTVASSNWQDENSLVGKSYSFRPYFKHALEGRDTRYFAIGTVTKEAGYYFSSPVYGRQGIVGVAVVKTALESLQNQWRETDDNLLLFDENRVVVLASNHDWRFKTLALSEPSTLSTLRNEYKYAGKELTPLVKATDSVTDEIRLNGTNYLINKTHLENQDWQLWQLTTKDALDTATGLAVVTSLMLFSLSGALFLYRIEKGRKNMLSAAAKEASNMRNLNRQLEAEITERQKAEQELNAAQAELIQASKLAALGQMSAAIVHEVNQPLAAIKTFGASTKLLLERGQTDAARKNLDEISDLTERLATITTDLKMFAGRTKEQGDPICLQDSIDKVLNLLHQLLLDADVIVRQEMPKEPVYVFGSAIRIEQVLTNLLTNAVDATRTRSTNRQIKMHLFIENDEVALRVSDNGTGLDTHALQHLFDPFFTTKAIGEGVGLGLAISYGIIQEMGGSLRVRNNDEGGALFSLRLAQACAQQPESSSEATD